MLNSLLSTFFRHGHRHAVKHGTNIAVSLATKVIATAASNPMGTVSNLKTVYDATKANENNTKK